MKFQLVSDGDTNEEIYFISTSESFSKKNAQKLCKQLENLTKDI